MDTIPRARRRARRVVAALRGRPFARILGGQSRGLWPKVGAALVNHWREARAVSIDIVSL
jgi:hypothetical protein